MKEKVTLKSFRQIATIEGISMIILLCFSAIKRMSDSDFGPAGVKYVGWAHGVLFVLYVYLLFRCWDLYSWSWKRVLLFFIASLIPFAPFWVDKKLKEEGNTDQVIS